MLFILGLTPTSGYYWTPATFTLSSLLFAYTLLRGRVFDFTPIALETVFQNISDLVIVLDRQGHIANFNLAAQAACGLSQEAIGAAPEQALSQEWARFIRLPVQQAQGLEKTRCPIDPAGADKDSPGAWRRVYELTSSALKNRTGRTIGALFLFHDISDREQLEHALEERVRERTHALEKTSQTLQQEVDGHARAVQALWESEVKYRTLFEPCRRASSTRTGRDGW